MKSLAVPNKPEPPVIAAKKTPVLYLVGEPDAFDGIHVKGKQTMPKAVVGSYRFMFLAFVERVVDIFVEENLHSSEEWPTAIAGLAGDVSKIESFLYEGSVLVPNVGFHHTELILEMHKVPLFMEWVYGEARSCRVMYDTNKNRLMVMHLNYSIDPENFHGPGGRAGCEGIFSFPVGDLDCAGRLKTLRAAFTPMIPDEEGVVSNAVVMLHESFSILSLCH